MSTPPSPHARSCALIQLHFVFSWFGDSAFHCLLMLPPAVVVPILTLSAITGPPAHALDSSAGEAFLWNGLLRAYAGKLEPQSLQMSCCAISTSSPVSTTTGELRLSPTGSRSGEESSSLSTPPLSRPSMQEAARGATSGARSARPSASLAQTRSAPTPSSCVLRGAASLRSPSRSQDAGAQRLSSSSVICPAAEPGPRRPTCGPAALQRGVQRWSGLLAFAAARSCARSFAASLLSLPLHGTANVDGPLPDLSDVLAEHRLDSPPHASRLPAR